MNAMCLRTLMVGLVVGAAAVNPFVDPAGAPVHTRYKP
jgi:hypothetical protein